VPPHPASGRPTLPPAASSPRTGPPARSAGEVATCQVFDDGQRTANLSTLVQLQSATDLEDLMGCGGGGMNQLIAALLLRQYSGLCRNGGQSTIMTEIIIRKLYDLLYQKRL
jgi:hypothetical protein